MSCIFAEHGVTAYEFDARIPMCMHMWEPIWHASASEANKLDSSHECTVYNIWQADYGQQVFRTTDIAAAKTQLLTMTAEVVIPACLTGLIQRLSSLHASQL